MADSNDGKTIHVDTTDGEMEVVYGWERLRPGILAYPASLELQCLMFIVGHLFDDIVEPV